MAEEKWLYENVIKPATNIDELDEIFQSGCNISKKVFENKPTINNTTRLMRATGLKHLNMKIKTISTLLHKTQECHNYFRIKDTHGMLKFIANTNNANINSMFKQFRDEDLISSECDTFLKALKILIKLNRHNKDANDILEQMKVSDVSVSEKLIKLRKMYEKTSTKLINASISVDTDQGIFDRIFMNVFMKECSDDLDKNCSNDDVKLCAYMKACENLTALILCSPPVMGLTEKEREFYTNYMV